MSRKYSSGKAGKIFWSIARIARIADSKATDAIEDRSCSHGEETGVKEVPTDRPGTPHSQADWRMVIYS